MNGTVSKVSPEGTPTIGFAATGAGPFGITIDAVGNVYTANRIANTVTKITPSGTATTLASTGAGTGPPAIVVDSAGNLYTANWATDTVSRITPDGVVTILGTTGDKPVAITIDAAGNVYTANEGSDDVTIMTGATPATSPAAVVPAETPVVASSPLAVIKATKATTKLESKAIVLTTKATVDGAGVLFVRGTTGQGKATKTVALCYSKKKIKKAGTYGMTCRVGKAARIALRTAKLTMTLTTTYKPTVGPAVMTQQELVIARHR